MFQKLLVPHLPMYMYITEPANLFHKVLCMLPLLRLKSKNHLVTYLCLCTGDGPDGRSSVPEASSHFCSQKAAESKNHLPEQATGV